MVLQVERVMGAAEIAARLGVSRQRVQQLVSRRDFPQPGQELAMGKVWVAADVEAWIRAHRPDLVQSAEEPTRPRRRVTKRAKPVQDAPPES